MPIGSDLTDSGRGCSPGCVDTICEVEDVRDIGLTSDVGDGDRPSASVEGSVGVDAGVEEEEGKSTKKTCYGYSVVLTPEVVSIVYLAEIYHIDLELLLLLYDRYREDLFYFFYMLAGHQVVIPRHAKLLHVMKFGDDVCKSLVNGQPPDLKTRQEIQVMERLSGLLREGGQEIMVTAEIPEVSPL